MCPYLKAHIDTNVSKVYTMSILEKEKATAKAKARKATDQHFSSILIRYCRSPDYVSIKNKI